MSDEILGHQRAVETLAAKLRRRQVVGSREAAIETVLVIRQVVQKARFSNIDELVTLIRSVGRRLVEAQPKGTWQSTLNYCSYQHDLSYNHRT